MIRKNIFRLLFGIFLGSFSTIVYSQVIQTPFDISIGGTEGDAINCMLKTQDSGLILGCYSNSNKSGTKSENSRGSNDFWLVKVDKNGDKQWDRTYGGNNSESIIFIDRTIDGGYVLGGSSSSDSSGDKSEQLRGNYDYWLVKVDKDGRKQWDRTYGGSKYDYIKSVIQTADKGYFLAGTSDSPISGEKSEAGKGRKDYWVIKTDSLGNIEWDKTIGGADEEFLTSTFQTIDQGFLLFGSTDSDIGYDVSHNSYGRSDIWVVKIDKNGNKEWNRRYGGNFFDYLTAVEKANGGGYILAATTSSDVGYDVSDSPRGVFDVDCWILKVSDNGTLLWDKRIGGNNNERFLSIDQLSNNSIIFAGISRSPISGEKSEENIGKDKEHDYWVVKTDSLGNIKWDKTWGGEEEDYASEVAVSYDGGYIVGGFSYSSPYLCKKQAKKIGNKVRRHGWLIKFYDGLSLHNIPNLCRGEDFYICYSIIGNKKNSDTLVFELSDSLGNFSSPKKIGQIPEADGNDTSAIKYSIPSNIAMGTYRIRLSRVQSKDTSISNYFYISQHPTANFSINNAINQCLNDNQFIVEDKSINNGLGISSVIWQDIFEDTLGNRPTDTLTLNRIGTWKIRLISSSFGCKDTIEKPVTILRLPKALIYAPSKQNSFCKNDSLELVSFNADTIKWLFNNSILAIDTTTIFAKQQGTYKLITSNDEGCKDTAEVYLTHTYSTKPVILGKTKPALYKLDSYTVSAKDSIVKFSWQVTSGLIQNGYNTDTIVVLWNKLGTGEVKLTVTSDLGCRDTITLQTDVVLTSTPPSLNSHKLKAYPNPFAKGFSLSFNALNTSSYSVEILDYMGNTVLLKKNISAKKGLNELFIEGDNIKEGIYICILRSEGKSSIIRLIKN